MKAGYIDIKKYDEDFKKYNYKYFLVIYLDPLKDIVYTSVETLSCLMSFNEYVGENLLPILPSYNAEVRYDYVLLKNEEDAIKLSEYIDSLLLIRKLLGEKVI